MKALATLFALAAASAFVAPEVDIVLRPFVPRSAPTNEVVPDGVLYRDGRGRIGADTLLRYDMLVGASRVAFRPCAKTGDAK